jgi:hypothetical protein
MFWEADNVEYRGVSMDAAYSGDTLIWTKYKAELVTSTTQITSTDTYILACPVTIEKVAVGVSRGLKTQSGNTSHMYATKAAIANDFVYVPGGAFKFKISNRYSYADGWYHLKDVSTEYFLAYYDDENVVSITYPYLSQTSIVGHKDLVFQITKSVDHHSSGHIKDLDGYTVRFGNSGQSTQTPTPTTGIWKYPAGTDNPNELTYRVATSSGQQIAMLYRLI